MTPSKILPSSRRNFLATASSLGAAALLGFPDRAEAEPPPETTRLRLLESPLTCMIPPVVAQSLLRAEGFTEVQYVRNPRDTRKWPPEDLLAQETDITFSFTPTNIRFIDAGAPVVALATAHTGCVELVANDQIRSTRDLHGRSVGISNDTRIFISMFAAYVGLDPEKDINWVTVPLRDRVPLFTQGKIDAFMCSPPLSVELRQKKIGHALVNTTTDKPWSQYSCCLITSTRDFVQRNPVATRRALRALLKGMDLCASEPERVARLIAERGLGTYESSLQALRELTYARWRDVEPDDSLRFWALRLHDVGAIKSTPQQIIARGTDWRFFNELKRELKA